VSVLQCNPLLRLAAAIGAAALCGCNLDWEKPDVSTPPPERFREARPRSAPGIGGAREFARKFGSRELSNIVDGALADNLDLAAAAARIQEADAQARVSSAAQLPLVSIADSVSRTQTPGTKTSATPTGSLGQYTTTRSNFAQLGLNASYEIDFWGKNEDAAKAAQILANASRFDRSVVEISTVASVLNAYFQVLSAQDRLKIAHENVKIADTVFQAIKARVEVGVATALDYSQQESVLAVQRATIPPLEQSLRQTRNTLAVLLGHTPESVTIKGGSLTRLHYPVVPPGLPSEALLRRPDVAEAEARLASQEFSVLQARAAFFPSITLTGQYGVQSVAFHNLLRPEAIAWQIAANAAQPLFDGYNLQGQYELQKGKYAELAALYRKQIITALSDVENALIAVRETARQVKLQGEAAAAARRAYVVAEARLREGTIDIVTLATTETTLFQTQDQLAQSRLAYYQSATTLYQALGGGFSPTTRETQIAAADAAFDADKGPWP